jgi:hypothetical protein
MTGLCHETTAAIGEAARWLAGTEIEHRLRPTVPLLRERYGLTATEAVQAIREADIIRKGGADASGS